MRFWNNEMLENIDGVVTSIERVLAGLPSPSPSPKREGRPPPARPAGGRADR